MAQNPYEILGVASDATHDEIRKAYRKLAKTNHPDLNPGDAAAADRFAEIASAYDILGDTEKRGRFDRGEIDASGNERPAPGYYRDYAEAPEGHPYASSAGYEDMGDMSDFFSDIFGARGRGGPAGGGANVRMRGQDVRYHLEVDFLEAVTGATKRVTMPDGKALDIAIPEGLTDGQTLRLKGQGGPGYGGGPAGDAYVEISVRPHPRFTREGDDIVLVLPITIDEAALGGKVEVPTTTGRVTLSVPKGASGGRTLRLRGKGVKKRGGGHGDQLVRLQIRLPDTIDDELAEFMEKWRAGHAYDPRKTMGEGR